MKKNFSYLLIVMVLVAGAFGCKIKDKLFMKVAPVKVSELSEFTGDFPIDNDTAVLHACLYGLATSGKTAASLVTYPLLSSFVQRVAPTFSNLKSDLYTLSDSPRIFPDNESVISSGQLDVSYRFFDEDFRSNGFLVLNGLLEVSANGLTDRPYPIEAAASGKADLEAVFKAIPEAAFNGALVNLKAMANGEITGEDDNSTIVESHIVFATNIGFSIDESENSLGGKFIVSIEFEETVTIDKDTDTEELIDSVDVIIVVKVYNNADELQGTYEYTLDDIEEYFDSLIL